MLKHTGWVVAALFAALSCNSAVAAGAEPPTTFKKASDTWKKDGLQPVRAEGLDLVYVRKESRLNGYSKVLLKSVSVDVNPDWRRKSGMSISTTPVKVKPVIEAVTAMVSEEVRKALEAGGYALVDAPGPDVAEIDIAVVNLFLIATDEMMERDKSVDAKSVGRMSLVATVRDAANGDLVLHAFDDEIGHKPDRPYREAAAECMDWVRSALAAWAGTLRSGLDISTGKRSLSAR